MMHDTGMEITDTDLRMMTAALAEARRAYDSDEIPVGAVVACGDRIIGRGHNLTERLGDVTAHAEMQAITAATLTIGGKYLTGCTLYVTVEPCLMCAGAIGWAQLSRVVIGCADPKRGYTAFTCRSPFHPKADVVTGVLGDECRELMINFFKQKRR